jgi:hypothetical protein
MRIVSSNHGTPTARSCCARNRADARAGSSPRREHITLETSVDHAALARRRDSARSLLVLIDIEANQVSLAVRCVAARVNQVAVWGAESRARRSCRGRRRAPQARTVRNGAFHRVRKPRDHAGRARGTIVAISAMASVKVISVPPVTMAMFAPAPVPFRYTMVSARRQRLPPSVSEPRSEARCCGRSLLRCSWCLPFWWTSILPWERDQALRCQPEAASHAGTSRASGTSARVASKSAW